MAQKRSNYASRRVCVRNVYLFCDWLGGDILQTINDGYSEHNVTTSRGGAGESSVPPIIINIIIFITAQLYMPTTHMHPLNTKQLEASYSERPYFVQQRLPCTNSTTFTCRGPARQQIVQTATSGV